MAQDHDIDPGLSLSLLEMFESGLADPGPPDPSEPLPKGDGTQRSSEVGTDEELDEADEEEEDEMTRLRQRNKDLNLQNEDLLLRIEELEAALSRSRRIVDDISRLRKPFMNLPPEIIFAIFERTILPSFLLDVSTASGPDSIWCQTMEQKLALISVCRSWYHIGLPFLYEEVSIRQIYQLPPLLRSLQANADIPPRLKSLTLHCLIPSCYYRQSHNLLTQLLSICPNLHAFSYSSPCPLPHLNTLPYLAPKITHLHLGDVNSSVVLDAVLGACSGHLVSLSLSSPSGILVPTGAKVLYENLTDLVVEYTGHTVNNMTGYFLSCSFPRLRRLTFKLRGNPSAWKLPELTNTLHRFCHLHGRNVTYFHVHPEYWWFMMAYSIDLETIIRELPNLVHLVLHPRTIGVLTHPSVRWIDVWSSHILGRCVQEWDVMFTHLNKGNFPSLQGVRTISSALAWFHTIPRLIPPECAVGDDFQTSFAFQFRGFHVRHKSNEISSVIAEWQEEPDEDDSSYEFEEESDDETSSWASSDSGNFNIERTSDATMDMLPSALPEDWDGDDDDLEN